MGKQKDPYMADARYVAAMLANGSRYALRDGIDRWYTEWADKTARMVADAMEKHPEMPAGGFDDLEKLIGMDGNSFDYDEYPATPAEKGCSYRVIMSYVDELQLNGFIANEHLMTEDFWEAGAMVPV